MSKKTYEEECELCKISQGKDYDVTERGGIIKLKGNWTLNHYGGKEGFLGWLILQPQYHREQLRDLEESESKALGPNIKDIEITLRKYWEKHFSKDPMERMYVIYFSESSAHLHFHVIARPKSIRELTLCRKACSGYSEIQSEPVKVEAWNMPFATKCRRFPLEYNIWKDGKINKAMVSPLIDWMAENLKQKE